MIRPPPRSTRTATLFPYTTLVRSNPVGWIHIYRLYGCRWLPAGDRPASGQALGPVWYGWGSREMKSIENNTLAGGLILALALPLIIPNEFLIHVMIMVFFYGILASSLNLTVGSSEERRVGNECVSTGISRWSPSH